jgi:hypothetical protein
VLARFERQACVSDAEARLHIARTENTPAQQFKSVVATSSGVREVEPQQRVVQSEKRTADTMGCSDCLGPRIALRSVRVEGMTIEPVFLSPGSQNRESFRQSTESARFYLRPDRSCS